MRELFRKLPRAWRRRFRNSELGYHLRWMP